MASRRGDDAVRAGMRVTWVGVGANLALVVCKLLTGLLGRSQALVADAVHSLSDLLTDAIVLVGLRLGRKAPDAGHHFGHARIETLASTLVGVSLVVVGGILGYGAVDALRGDEENAPTALALVGAALSIGVKEILYHYTVRVGRRIRSQALLANAWHHRSDALSSVTVVVGVGAALVHPAYYFFDAIAALVVAVLVAGIGLRIVWMTVREIVDTAPGVGTSTRIRRCVEEVPGVENVHDLKIRVGGGQYYVQFHILVDGNATVFEGHRLAKQAEAKLTDSFDEVADVIVHVDPAPPGPAQG